MRSRNKRKKSWYFIWTALFVLFVISLLSFIISLPIFKIAKVEVKGVRLILPELIIKTAEIPIGENIFLTRFDRAESEIGSIGAVKEVEIIRRLPNIVIINVKERREAAVSIIDDQSVLIDEDGVIINPGTQKSFLIELPDISNLPVLTGIKKEWIDDGLRLRGEAGKGAIKLLAEFKKYVSPQRLEIDLSDSENITLMLDDTLRVKFGNSIEIERKFKTFEPIYNKLKEKKNSIEYIDVSCPDFPVVRYK